jgi:hypothetical protein
VPKGCRFLSVDGGEVSSELELDPEHDRTDGEHQRLLEHGQVSGLIGYTVVYQKLEFSQ